jgi:hypothetical protein
MFPLRRIYLLVLPFILLFQGMLWFPMQRKDSVVAESSLPRSIPFQHIGDTQGRTLRMPEVVQRSLHLKNRSSTETSAIRNMTVALCHKSLFGNLNLLRILDWVAYHRLLGFDRIFMSYLPSVEQLPGFALLQALPYVTLFENTNSTVVFAEGLKNYKRLGGGVNQMDLEAKCLEQDAAGYDWVLLSDADEYLWWSDTAAAATVQQFIQPYQTAGYDYISLGKNMYTMRHAVRQHVAPFAIGRYPFTAGAFCTMESRRGRECARKNGRAKLLVKPAVHKAVKVHGTHVPAKRKQSIHLHHNVAHLKEWNATTLADNDSNVTLRPSLSFQAHSPDEISIYGFKLYPKNPDGSVTMEYDGQLADWLEFVAQHGNVEP